MTLAEKDHEGVTCADRQRIAHGQLDELLVVPRPADEHRPRRLAEGEPEAEVRRAARERLVQVLHRLDEVRLAEDQVQLLRLLDGDRLQLELSAHGVLPSRIQSVRSLMRARRPGTTMVAREERIAGRTKPHVRASGRTLRKLGP